MAKTAKKPKYRLARIVPIGLTLVAVAGIGLYRWSETTTAKAGALFLPDDAQIVARGKAVYGDFCASCHGENLEGQVNWRERGSDGLLPAPPHDQTGHTWHHTDDVLFGITKYGVGKFAGLDDYKSSMQPFEGVLSDDNIIAVLSYVKSRWPGEVRRRHDQMNAQK